MSKELEALEKLYKNTYSVGEYEWQKEHYNVIKQALTPPTAEEVCKALKEFFKNSKYHNYIDTIYYSDGGKYFYTEDENRSLVELMFDNYYIHEIPPHLITLIGRFYEALEND